MALYILAGAALLVLASEFKWWEPRRLSGAVPTKDHTDQPWTKLVQKGQVIVSEAFTSIGGYPIATDGRDFMYSPDVDEVTPSSGMYQMENPQEMPVGI